MGLAGRKLKQRIANDPRNLSWADDAARFGMNYLAKFGWDSSKGLGASGEGRKSHPEVSKKLDMLGIGAAQQLDPNGIAWKQNKDFENLLKRLNGDVEVAGFEKAGSGEMAGVGEENFNLKDEGTKKRKGKDNTEAPNKKKKKIEKGEAEDPRANESINLPSERETSSGSSVQRRAIPHLPRHRAHRARAIAAKNLSSKSAAHVSEILGIPPTPSLSTTATSCGRTLGADTRQGVEPMSNTFEIGKITTATKSVDDYFKDKLKTKKSPTFVNPFASSLQDHTERDTSHDTPRAGLGSSSRTVFGSTLSSTFPATSKTPLPSDDSSQTEVVVETHAVDESTATLDTENRIKKKRRKMDEHQDNWVRKEADALVSEDDARSLREKKERKTVDVGECQFERLLDREDKSKKNTAAGAGPPDLATKKKKGGKRKKKFRLEIRD